MEVTIGKERSSGSIVVTGVLVFVDPSGFGFKPRFSMGSAIGSAAVTDSTAANGIGGGIDDRKVGEVSGTDAN